MTLDLTSNLVSEAIGILFTVLIVDKLIARREKAKWKNVNDMFMSYASAPVTEIIDAYKEWLMEMDKVKQGKLSDQVKHLLMLGDYLPSSELLYVSLGKPIGSKLMEFARQSNPKSISMMSQSLMPFLVEGLPYQTAETWERLQKRLERPIDKINDLFDRFPGLVSPELAEPMIRLSIELENLKSKKFEIANSETGAMALAMVSSYSVEYSIKLFSHINKGRVKSGIGPIRSHDNAPGKTVQARRIPNVKQKQPRRSFS